MERQVEEYEKATMYIQAKLIYDGSVLIFNYVVEENPDDPHQNTEDTSYFLFKVGGTISWTPSLSKAPGIGICTTPINLTFQQNNF